MSLTEINKKLNELTNEWEQFKDVNERRLNEIEKRGSADPLTTSHLERIGTSLDKKMDRKRPTLGSSNETHLSIEHKHSKAFSDYIRKGREQNLLGMEVKSNISGDSEAGYSITSKMASYIADNLNTFSPMRRLAQVSEISTDALELIEDNKEGEAGWSGDDNTKLLNEGDQVALQKRAIQVHELYAQPKATQKLLDDPRIDLEAWLSRKLSDIFITKENYAFIHGDGNGKPKGILKYPNGKDSGKVEQTEGRIDDETLLKLFYSLKEKYSQGATFLMNRQTVQQVRMLKDQSSGKYLWQPSLAIGTPDKLLGADVVICPDMPSPSENSMPIAFGNFKQAYQIVDRQHIKVMRDPFTHKPFVKFYATKRVGADVANFEALKLLSLTD